MTEASEKNLAYIVLHCEEKLNWRYGENQVPISTDGKEIIIVSDLHIGRGLTTNGTFAGTENFFANEAFRRFLRHTHQKLSYSKNKHGLLVINGDFIDFLRIMAVPQTDADFHYWEEMLKSIGINKRAAYWLKDSVSSKEKTFGLKTHDYKSVWKLDLAIRGHAPVFNALAEWISLGHQLVITKGNHDLEWYWLAVRNYLRLSLARKMHLIKPEKNLQECFEVTTGAITFVDNSCVIDSSLYVEHGHNYDHICKVVGDAKIGKNADELNLPFGSFFNRYLVNELELVYPFYDNVRPKPNILHMLMRDHFFFGLKVLFRYLPFTLRVIPKGYVRYLLKPIMWYLLAFGIPLLFVVVAWWQRLGIWLISTASPPQPAVSVWDFVKSQLLGFMKDTGFIFLSYLFSRIAAHFQLVQPDFLKQWAMPILEQNPQYLCVTMGHTHNPEQYQINGRWYINSSTWIPVIETDSADIREDRTYAVLIFERNEENNLVIQPLLRWNDDAGRLEPMTVVISKDEK